MLSKEEYYELLEEQHQHNVIMHVSQIDAECPKEDPKEDQTQQ